MGVMDSDDVDLFHEWVELAEAEGPDSVEALAFIGRHSGRAGFVEMVRGWRAGGASGDRLIVTCPYCGHIGGDHSAFGISLADECFCPGCGERFELDEPEGDDSEDEG